MKRIRIDRIDLRLTHVDRQTAYATAVALVPALREAVNATAVATRSQPTIDAGRVAVPDSHPDGMAAAAAKEIAASIGRTGPDDAGSRKSERRT
jgi:hypothetical protein